MAAMWGGAMHRYSIPGPSLARVQHVSAIELGTVAPTNCPGAGECVFLSESVVHVR